MKCSVNGCTSQSYKRGMCNTHYMRVRKYGDPHFLKNRPSGSGTIMNHGYVMHEIDGRSVLEHVLVAERALGKRLPKGAVVHHWDEDRQNNEPTNLLICQSHAYHQLIHKRMRAFAACGHADWRKCQVCQKYDDPEKLVIYPNSIVWHKECNDRRNGYKR